MLDFVDVLVAVLVVGGVIGSLLPLIPGTPLILAGAAIYGYATHFKVIGPGRLAILAAIALVAWLVTRVAMRRSRGTRYAVAGAVLGTALGMFFPAVRLLLGRLLLGRVFVGRLVLGRLASRIAAKLVRGGHLSERVRNPLDAFLGALAGAMAHFALALAMVALFVWWVRRG